MAELGAQLASSQTDRSQQKSPSVFDVLAQETLLTQLRPALKHLFKVRLLKNFKSLKFYSAMKNFVE